MRVTVVGAGTIFPDADRGPCALLVEACGAKVLVDGGSGTLRSLARLGHDPRGLDLGVVSHRHLDHIGELPSLLFLFKVAGRSRPYPLYGGAGLLAHVERLEATYGALTTHYGAPVCELSLAEVAHAEIAPGLTLRTAPAVHKHGALHLRFEAEGRAVAFSGDTGPSEALVDLAAGADLLIVECALATPGADHLCASDIADLVLRAETRRVVLTHLYPEVDERVALRTVAATGAQVERASDGWIWESPPAGR